MSRFICQGTWTDGGGVVVNEGTVTVYLAGGTTEATIYEAKTGDAADNNTVEADISGHFVFWVDIGDYALTQKFKYVLSKASFSSETWDNIVIFPDINGTYLVKGEPTSGSETLTAAMLLGGLIDEDPEGSVNWTTDTAANLVAAIPNAYIGYTFETILMNDATGSSAEVVTVIEGSGVTLHGSTVTLTEGTNETAKLVFRLVNITSTSEAVDCYILTGI